ncbi:phenylacetate-coenzyme A ligase PaaK-like adenylate-forming protein [Williamsia limnetica]|uniref:Phenylacetate-coenzyme A ligase PaaK-like adenylate-forming protein n=1 Tax=Williamsia limnetica TaxID=882452 RepID=A0A318RQ60_WILLI|nr:phenylacetate--CoA ligase family protein [Williamsia limnetica]PYE13963.1 phenylacetate-coenzyme A ligase PaaK-like adenylate-forming protein [Williamsia limnetica]
MASSEEELKSLQRDIRKAGVDDPVENTRRNSERLNALVTHARTHSTYFAELYRGLPDEVQSVAELPVTNKAELMASFDDWVTDPRITRGTVEQFLADSDAAGSKFLGEYLLTVSSGTTGTPGYFVTDRFAMQVARALGVRERRPSMIEIARIVKRGRRIAVISTDTGHRMARALLRWQQAEAGGGQQARLFPVDSPLDDLVDQLNDYDPAVLTGYASAVALLAGEQVTGRLRISPVVVRPVAEGMSEAMTRLVSQAWRAPVINTYGANECLSIARECAAGRMHLNSDWVILEPVDRNGAPTPPGEPSHSSVLTTLFRRVQPIVRYELGDSITMDIAPCKCGNRLPAFTVTGRMADFLEFSGPQGTVRIPPLLITSAVDAVAPRAQYQIVVESPDRVALRLRVPTGDDRDAAADAAVGRLRELLTDRGLHSVAVVDTGEAPRRSTGGKFLRVVR